MIVDIIVIIQEIAMMISFGKFHSKKKRKVKKLVKYGQFVVDSEETRQNKFLPVSL